LLAVRNLALISLVLSVPYVAWQNWQWYTNVEITVETQYRCRLGDGVETRPTENKRVEVTRGGHAGRQARANGGVYVREETEDLCGRHARETVRVDYLQRIRCPACLDQSKDLVSRSASMRRDEVPEAAKAVTREAEVYNLDLEEREDISACSSDDCRCGSLPGMNLVSCQMVGSGKVVMLMTPTAVLREWGPPVQRLKDPQTGGLVEAWVYPQATVMFRLGVVSEVRPAAVFR
jgi:hypothetical protein